MTAKVEESDSAESEEAKEEVVKEEIKLQYHLYIFVFVIIYYGSWLIPGFLFLSYYVYIFTPNFLEIANFVDIFLNLNSLLTLLGMPLNILAGYYVRLVFLGIFTKIIWWITEKISPTKDGIIPRNIRSKVADYYHLRSFMIKYGKNIFTKGMYPWLSKWFFTFIGASKIGKGTVIEESVGSDKFINVGKNCYIGVASTLASHVVQGIFGNIQYFEVKVGDNVTFASMGHIGPGAEVKDNAYLLPWATTHPLSMAKGDHNYYFGLPMRRIFRRKIMSYLQITEEDLEKNRNIDAYLEKMKEEKKLKRKKKKDENENENLDFKKDDDEEVEEKVEEDYNVELTDENLALDFTTSSSISRVNIKFLALYIPIYWLSGLMVAIFWYEYTKLGDWFGAILFMPIAILIMIYLFILGVLFFSKLLLIFINLLHKPKEGVFLAERGDRDWEFWMLRIELKKIALWLLRYSPLTYLDVIAFRWFGVKMDFSSHLNDAWCDADFITFGRKVLIGQGANLMSSMIVGKYLIIQKIILNDYVMVGGHASIAPGTIIGEESVVGAVSTTTPNRILEEGWIFTGIPVIKLKKNKYYEQRRDLFTRRVVDEESGSRMNIEVNIDEDKKDQIKTGDGE